MNAAQVTALNAQRLATDYVTNGKPVKLDNVQGVGLYAAPRYFKELNIEGGGYREGKETSVAIRKTDWTGYTTTAHFNGKLFALPEGESWQVYRIAAATELITRGEWKLEVVALF